MSKLGSGFQGAAPDAEHLRYAACCTRMTYKRLPQFSRHLYPSHFGCLGRNRFFLTATGCYDNNRSELPVPKPAFHAGNAAWIFASHAGFFTIFNTHVTFGWTRGTRLDSVCRIAL